MHGTYLFFFFALVSVFMIAKCWFIAIITCFPPHFPGFLGALRFFLYTCSSDTAIVLMVWRTANYHQYSTAPSELPKVKTNPTSLPPKLRSYTSIIPPTSSGKEGEKRVPSWCQRARSEGNPGPFQSPLPKETRAAARKPQRNRRPSSPVPRQQHHRSRKRELSHGLRRIYPPHT